jgi:hypothetical protein
MVYVNYTRGGRGHSFRFSSISFQFLFKGCALGDADAARALPPLPLWLDLANERLWRGDQALSLRPKTFALRRYLVEHPAQLLTKAALLEALWPEAGGDGERGRALRLYSRAAPGPGRCCQDTALH